VKNITYAIHTDGYVVSRVGRDIAWPVLDYKGMTPGNNYQMIYNLERMSVFGIGPEWDLLKWTKKIPIEVKNEHRAFWGMKPISSKRRSSRKRKS